jgi:TIR domain
VNIRLYADNTISLSMTEIIEHLTLLAPSLTFALGKAKFSVPGFFVMRPHTYQSLKPAISKESSKDDIVLFFTEKPYDNNYFWESEGNHSIISLSGWDQLTNLSRNNGAVYFICAILIRKLRIGFHKDKNTGCINDFWLDKTGVDTGMRCAFVCEKCLHTFRKTATDADRMLLQDIQAVLNDLSAASRSNTDICDFWSLQNKEESFDVFMCHNSEEKDSIREMNRRLVKSGIKTWLDEEQLPPGRIWQELLEEQIASIKTAAVFVGNSGIGPWQNMEIRTFLQECLRRRCPVIPVILPECSNVPALPLFLTQLTWVDLRKSTPDPYKNLLWGITGKKH